MIIAVHQPQYLPWLGYFDKMARSDLFVFLDNVQYNKEGVSESKPNQNAEWCGLVDSSCADQRGPSPKNLRCPD